MMISFVMFFSIVYGIILVFVIISNYQYSRELGRTVGASILSIIFFLLHLTAFVLLYRFLLSL